MGLQNIPNESQQNLHWLVKVSSFEIAVGASPLKDLYHYFVDELYLIDHMSDYF